MKCDGCDFKLTCTDYGLPKEDWTYCWVDGEPLSDSLTAKRRA